MADDLLNTTYETLNRIKFSIESYYSNEPVKYKYYAKWVCSKCNDSSEINNYPDEFSAIEACKVSAANHASYH